MNAGRQAAVPCRNPLAGDRPMHLALFLLCLAPLLLSGVLSTDGVNNSLQLGGLSVPVTLPCLFRIVTGGRYRCPVCGMTRSFIYMSRLNIPRALAMNPAGVPLYLLCLFELPYRLVRFVSGRPAAGLPRIFELSLAGFTCALDTFFFVAQFF